MRVKSIPLISALLVVALAISSCATSKDFKELYPNLSKDDFAKSYQVAFVCGCINAGTNEGLDKLFKENNDLGLFTEVEVLSHGIVKEADSLGRVYAKKVQPINYEDAGGGKPYFSNCIYYSFDKEVRSMVEKRYKQLRKGKLTYHYEN